MTTPIEVSFELPISSAQGFALVQDKAALENVMVETGAIDPKVEVLPHSDGSTQIRISRGFTGEWPSFVAAKVGDVIRVQEIRQWLKSNDGQNFNGTIEISTEGQPVKMSGQMRIFAHGQHCKVSISGVVKANILFVGPKVEQLVQKVMIQGIMAEAQALRDYLSRNQL